MQGGQFFLVLKTPFLKYVLFLHTYMAAKYMFHLIYRIYLIFDEKLIP